MKSIKLWRKLWVLPVFIFALMVGLFLFTGSASAATLEYNAADTYSPTSVDQPRLCDLDSNYVIAAYRDGSDSFKGKLKIGTKSANSISWSSATGFNGTASVDDIDLECLNSGKFIVAYEDGSDGKGKAIVVTVTTGSIDTPGTEVEFNAGGISYPSIADLSDSKVVIAYQDTPYHRKLRARSSLFAFI